MNYIDYLGPILAVLGLGLQWVRQYRKMSDWWTGLFALVLSAGGYALCNDFSGAVRGQVIKAIIWLPGGVATVLGGTFTAAKIGNAGDNIVPRTDSK